MMRPTPLILIIDDEAPVRLVMRRALERAGYRVEEAADGAAGVQVYRTEPADVVITDLFMPEQDGIETIQVLREEFPAARIIAVSGGATMGAAGPLQDAQLFGADMTLSKPFSIDALVSAVVELLGSDG